MAYKGRFRPSKPEKYLGDATNIIYRSLWELRVMKWLDYREDVLQWSSEEFHIPYFSPVDNKFHRYFPDFYVKLQHADGKIHNMVLEVKPHSQTYEPKKKLTTTGRVSRRYLNEMITYKTNLAKWDAAQAYCLDRGWEFRILSEKELGLIR
jgi:hypothetical protein